MKVTDEKLEKCIEKLTEDIWEEAQYMMQNNPYNHSVLYSLVCDAYFLGKSFNDEKELRKRVKKLLG